MNWIYKTLLIGCLAAQSSAAAMAQSLKLDPPVPSNGPAPAPGSAPDRTAASFGDWVFRCDRRTDVTPPQRFCEVAQVIQRQGDAGSLAQLAVGRLGQASPLRVTALLPVNVSLQTTPRVVAEERDGVSIELAWVSCIPTGCFADTVANDDMLQKMRAQKSAARFVYKDSAGREIALPLSLRGFGEAMDAFLRDSANVKQ